MKQSNGNEWRFFEEVNGKMYKQFLEFALSYSDYFSVSTFKSVRKKDLNNSYHVFLKKVDPYKVDTYSFKQLPQHYERGQRIQVYSINESTKKILINTDVEGIYSWLIPSLPEDLSFFKGKKVWFNSISHEKIAKIYSCDENLLRDLSRIATISDLRV